MKRIVSISVLLVSLCSVLYAQVDLQPIVNIKLNKSESITVKQLKTRVEIYKKQSIGGFAGIILSVPVIHT